MTETQTYAHDSSPGRAAPAEALLGGRYELGAEIAGGGMGLVYAARDHTLGRDVAVKVLRPELAGHPRVVARFVEEARITAQLQHPGIPPVHDLGTLPDGRPFLAMKLIKGRTLADVLKDRLTPNTGLPVFLSVFESVCQAVAYAHSKGVVHRDLKPANVMVGAFGEVQVMDWGLAKALDVPDGDRLPIDDPIGTVIDAGRDPDSYTQAGSLLGTPAYMPPEQAKGEVERIDRRADVFALGAVLCEILTGQPPYTGPLAEVKAQAVMGLLEPAMRRLGECAAGRDLVTLCGDCLHPDPDRRVADAGAVARRLARVQADAERAQAYQTRVAERTKQRVATCCAIGLAADLQHDPEAADRWLHICANTTALPEQAMPRFCLSLDSYNRPDLAYRLAVRLMANFPDWVRKPDLGLRVDAAWFAVRWAAGTEGCSLPDDPTGLAGRAMTWLELDLGDIHRCEVEALRSWLTLAAGRMPAESSPSWPSLFRTFPSLADRWERLEDAVRRLAKQHGLV